MSPRPSHLQKLLRILRLMLGVLCGALGAREAVLRARCDRLPDGHRKRAVMAKELRRIAWAREMLRDPELLDDPAFRGMAAERAHAHADAGRRAMARRRIHPTPLKRLRGAEVAPTPRPEEARCTIDIDVASALPGLTSRAAAMAHVPALAWDAGIPPLRGGTADGACLRSPHRRPMVIRGWRGMAAPAHFKGDLHPWI